MEIKAPKGTRDLLPAESYKWQYIEANIREITRLFGYREVRVPIFEHTELFLRGVGDTTDVVQKEMYTFLDKGDRSITLRPEGTAGVARSFIEHGLAGGPQPTKMYYLSFPVFRYENPQAGRLRQHHQFGVEVFGGQDASTDAEVIHLAWTVLRRMGVEALQLNINSIGCPQCRPQYNAKLVEYFRAQEDKLCDTCRQRLEKNPLRILDCKEEGCRAVAKGAPLIIDSLCDDCRGHFEALKGYLEAIGIDYVVNPYIVRGLDYYTKTVFEIISNEIGAQGTVCGGGRYDGLIHQLGGPQMPGVGFGMGIERLLMVMESAGAAIPPAKPITVFLCTMGPAARSFGFKLLRDLRLAGVSAEMDHSARSMKAQMKYANKLGVRYTLAIGDNELERGIFRLRNMDGGEEREVKAEDLIDVLTLEENR